MCSVTGVLIIKPENYEKIEKKLIQILKRAEDRGRDSFGVIVIEKDGSVRKVKALGRPSTQEEKLYGILDENSKVIIANNRAEPTTEYVRQKTEEDIQPFEGERYIVTHNGIIANDLELEKKYNVIRRTKIDSAVVPPILDKYWNGEIEQLKKILNDIKGSFAFIIGDKKRPNRIYIAQNFKPVYMMYDRELGAIFFTSLDDYFDASAFDSVTKLDPYSIVEVNDNLEIRKIQLLDKKIKKVLVIASGGLDSTVAATYLLRQGYEITLLHFNYHHKAEEREREAVKKIAEYLQVPLIEIDTDLFKIIGHTTLLKGGGEIVKDRLGEEGAEFAHEWVPARNLIFYSVALALAEAYGYDAIASGINLEEAGAYPDNEMEFVRLFAKLSPYATGPNKKVEVMMPVGNLVKHEIVKLGVEIGAPLHLTWSCYEGGQKHCGKCGPCYMRKMAFRINGLNDPVEYEN
ncbi:7-cyano-7-deazaguanine synthase QueC [Sulfurisphaera tokodaii]|uniref:7-cyano-7-deazaguanine synthase 2 n=2 Tax=Sulfurisphaera tokodaii TaxID=111955 RepID=QUEC2_SULTO|nr:7-cyano-7-deazaguanine synthase QueC [Sulfurisphaera tokodaii]Q96Y49.1 RecName: Full=7-cyano-7-deazaguanine synthase 2; AltName: Full=7-cyano-7-carbaguanine synthase 2; AltName: Full=Archaeosine biosynthesis protein QueC 2; AltName: Full=PreQ(0) synthase 2 [Sulfurisphaera tokodaii str. 7]BAK54783.1 7-cyano-7-deazaguanine synthase [Sulfurisphaera tokodaii str. 7]HII75138.1 7-cyano-7-deazaguanine synthase QueC [Sulfurisphaera tokodaii]